MKARFFFSALILMLLSGVLAGCGTTAEPQQAAPATGNTEQTQKRIIKHELGETEIVGVPSRIVVMEFSFADALASLGVQPVGIADDNNAALLIHAVKEKMGAYTSVGSRYEPNMELISSLAPDLIIADLNHHKAVYEKLKQIAPTIILDDHQADYAKMLSNYPIIADAVGKAEEGKKRLAEHQAKMDEIKAKLAKGEARKVVPAVVNAKGFFAHSQSSYAGSLMQELGLHDPVTGEESYPKTNLEQLVALNPDVLFLMKAGEKTIIDEWKQNPLWNSLAAGKNGKVFEVQRNVWALSRGLIGSELSAEEAVTLLNGK